MNAEQASFLPFHAINEFMLDDYREQVIRAVLSRQDELPEERQAGLSRVAKTAVRVPGFRNSAKAPAALKVKPFIKAFGKDPEAVAEVIASWAELSPELRLRVYDLLVSLGWELLPAEADRTQLPGFLPQWPSEHDFAAINQEYQGRYPDFPADSYDVSLMTVWLSMRLPMETIPTEDNLTE
jgi:hypothetical protein